MSYKVSHHSSSHIKKSNVNSAQATTDLSYDKALLRHKVSPSGKSGNGDHNSIDFDGIKVLCESDLCHDPSMYGFDYFKRYRQEEWPDANAAGMGQSLSEIYQACKQRGVPNAHGARCILPTGLNIPA